MPIPLLYRSPSHLYNNEPMFPWSFLDIMQFHLGKSPKLRLAIIGVRDGKMSTTKGKIGEKRVKLFVVKKRARKENL